jgi:UDP:flavonoid glycosyltransferase YjiC (YdhE family)
LIYSELEVMSKIDLLITNGGYGTADMAISHGIPVISAGLTEDMGEVSAHVQWSGAGIDLRTNQATPEAIKYAVDEIFTQPGYRDAPNSSRSSSPATTSKPNC